MKNPKNSRIAGKLARFAQSAKCAVLLASFRPWGFEMKSEKVYPAKIYKSLARACHYGRVLPGFVQPVFRELDGLMFERIGFAIGPAKRSDVWLSYRQK